MAVPSINFCIPKKLNSKLSLKYVRADDSLVYLKGLNSIGSFGATVANKKSATKRVEIAERNRLRNKAYKSAVRTLTKRCVVAAETYAKTPTPEQMQEVQVRLSAAFSKIDKAVKRGVLHPNNGDRKKSRLVKTLKRYTSPATGNASGEVTATDASTDTGVGSAT